MTLGELKDRYDEDMNKMRQEVAAARRAEMDMKAKNKGLLSDLEALKINSTDEINSLSNNVFEFKIQLRDLENENSNFEIEVLNLQRNLSTLTAECELYKSKVESLEQDLTQKQNEHERQRRLLESSRVALESQVSLLIESENSLRVDLRRAEGSIEDLTIKNRELEDNIKAFEESYNRKDIDSGKTYQLMLDAQRQQHIYEDEVARLRNKIEQMKDEIKVLSNSKHELTIQVQTLEVRCNASQLEINTLRTDLEISLSKSTSLERELSQSKYVKSRIGIKSNLLLLQDS
jgi:chromosome segregation ATPase